MCASVCLCGGSFERSPGVEAAHEAVGLVSLPHQSQLPGVFGVLGAHVLDVNLERRRRISKMWKCLTTGTHIYTQSAVSH